MSIHHGWKGHGARLGSAPRFVPESMAAEGFMNMKRTLSYLGLATFLLTAGIGGAVAALSDATEQELEDLQMRLRNLEAEIEAVEGDQEVTPDIRQRVQDIRENVIYLKVKMKKHREEGGAGTGVDDAEIEELRDAIARLSSDLHNLHKDAVEGTVTVPVGVELRARLQKSLSTATSQVGDKFTATVVDPVVHRGYVAIPAGAVLEGIVELVDRAESRTDRKARMVLAFERLEVRGEYETIEATVVDASGDDLETGIGDEKTKIGVGAGIGTILGAVLGGKKGAGVGAVLGGAGAILATEGKDVELPRGTVLTVRLDQDVTVPVPET